MDWDKHDRALPWLLYPRSLREAQQLTPIGVAFGIVSVFLTISSAARPLDASMLLLWLSAVLCLVCSVVLPNYLTASRQRMDLFVSETRYLFRRLIFRRLLLEIRFIDTDSPLPPMDKVRELEERLESLQRRKRVPLREILNFADEVKEFTRPFLGPQSS